MYGTHGHLFTTWNNQPFLSPASLQRYARAITRKGSPLTNCFGFIDGTVREISRRGEHQRVLYNGQKRVHALKFQSVAIPNRLIANLYDLVEGRRHDAGISKLKEFHTAKRSTHTQRRASLPLRGPCLLSSPSVDRPVS